MGDTPWTVMTTRAPAVLTNNKKHVPFFLLIFDTAHMIANVDNNKQTAIT